jgi:hypothetical protein
LARNAVELISATRYSKGGKKYGGPVILSLISTLANLLIRIKSSNRITDFTTGIKFWNKNNFGSFEFEKGQGWNSIVRLHVFAIKNGFKFSEIPIISADRPIGVKKKITFKQKIYMIKKYLSTFFDLIMLI